MGATLSYCVSSQKPAKIILMGLDASGKTTILYKFLNARDTIDTFPTVGFNVEQITHSHLPMKLWDFGGQMIVRNLRRESFQDYDAIIFVIDSADTESFYEARQELWKVLSFAPDAILLILANKQDLKGAANIKELHKIFDLEKLPKTTQFLMQETCGLNGNGLESALSWLSKTIKEKRRKTVTATYL